jgi:hypothetical protein
MLVEAMSCEAMITTNQRNPGRPLPSSLFLGVVDQGGPNALTLRLLVDDEHKHLDNRLVHFVAPATP